MLKIEKFVTASPEQWEIIIEGARNPMNSWDQMDSEFVYTDPYNGEPAYDYKIGPNDRDLLMRLSKAGTDESKYRRMLPVHVTLTAPLYWWKEADTYKVGTVSNSCSTMHKIAAKEFVMGDFSTEHLISDWGDDPLRKGIIMPCSPLDHLMGTIASLNLSRNKYLEAKTKPMKDESKRAELVKKYWWQMIQLLPSSYNQKRTLFLNYEVLANMYRARRHHKLDEWHVFCDWIETLPYSEIIIGTTK